MSIPDPFGIVAMTEQTVRTGVRLVGWWERQVFGFLRSRMDAASDSEAPTPAGAMVEGLDAKMQRLLDRAIEQSTTSGRQELFHRILDQLVPDEARIIGALSDGSSSPLVNVYARTRGGLMGEVVLENMSLIAKTANLALPELTPMYVSHLLSLGLVESGPEDSSMKDEYEILAADMTVLQAVKRASRPMIPARVEKYSLQLSGLGLELWAAASAPGRQE